jgi:threonine/homoserine efflux transporter RhtA
MERLQGLLTAIVALLLYGRMVSILGATGGAAFVALTPATTALMAISMLGEWPSAFDCVAIALISIGVRQRWSATGTAALTFCPIMCGVLGNAPGPPHVAS